MKGRICSFVYRHMEPFVDRFESNIYISNLRKVIIGIVFPLSLVGSIFYIVASPPRGTDIFLFKSWLSGAIEIKQQLMMPYYFTLGFAAIVTAIAYGYKLAEEFNVDTIQAGILSGLSYMALCFPNWSDAKFSFDAMSEVTGPNGILFAAIVAIICARFLRFVKSRGLLFNKKSGLSGLLYRGFEFLSPMTVIICLMWVCGWLLSGLLLEPLPTGISNLLSDAVSMGSGLFEDILASLISSVMYFVGMDGGRINQPVYSVFMNSGGFGTLLPLVVLYLLSYSRHLKQIGKASIIPALFNIPYPFLYAVTFILSPVYVIPIILCPIITTVVNYLVVMSGILTVTVEATSTMPVFLSGYFSTLGGFVGILLQLFNIVIAFVIYYPFYKFHETKILSQHGTQQEKRLAAQTMRKRAGRFVSGILGVRHKPISTSRD